MDHEIPYWTYAVYSRGPPRSTLICSDLVLVYASSVDLAFVHNYGTTKAESESVAAHPKGVNLTLKRQTKQRDDSRTDHCTPPCQSHKSV